jgi:UDP-N-acetylglucosamine--dolichyl-phosphate N-acetylglucosaminephosphotransferase
MAYTTIIIPMLVSMIATYFATKYAIRYFQFIGLMSTDVHKRNKPLVPCSAGIPMLAGMLVGLLVYIFMNVFIFGVNSDLAHLFAGITSIFIIALVGLFDDLNSVQVKEAGFIEGKRGLKRWQKPVLTLFAAFPLMAIMAGTTDIFLPFVGTVELGLLYPFLIVPAAIVVFSNAVNMLGGFNGIEVGMGLVYTFSLGTFALVNDATLAAIFFFTAFGALAGLARYNFPPARILSGDSLTYMLGAVVAVGAILGNMEKAVLLTMLPFVVQAALKFWSLKATGKFASDLGQIQRDGTIKSRYGGKVYSWTHLVMKSGRFDELKIVLIMMGVQAAFSVLPFLNLI